MANLAIHSHPTEGNKIIEIFEELGGVNTDNHEGDWEGMYYLLEDMPVIVRARRVSTYKSIEFHSELALSNQKENYAFFTLEEFLEKFPYKIGDKVTPCQDKSIWEISGFIWDSEVNIIKYIIKREGDCVSGWYTADELQLVKENQNIMTNLAIRGHKERGKEVIEIFKMLGGKDVGYGGIGSQYYNYLDEFGNITGTTELPESKTFVTYTLEEFLEKYPYKVGDKVTHSDYESPLEIVGMKWKDDSIQYEVYTNDYGYWFIVDELQPYKEETREEIIIDTIKESEDRYRIHINYQFDIEVDEGEYYLVRRKPQYPKTYEECLVMTSYDKEERILYLLEKHKQLLICRNAYWKMAGEKMGLGKSWEPNWDDENEFKYGIYHFRNGIMYDGSCINSTLLAFPTAEMRDTFYENFKDLIEECKELL